MRLCFLFLITILLLSACSKTEPEAAANPDVKRYPLKGKVISVDKEKKRAKIEHEEIPGFMEAMTMDFPIREDWVWSELRPGAEVRAELVVDLSAKDPYWLEKVGIIAAVDPDRPALPVDERFAQIGMEVPDFKLTNQDGKRTSMKDFRGKTLALTFIYAQCPLPEYC